MDDRELKIKVTAEYRSQLEGLKTGIKEVDLEFKRGNLTAKEAKELYALYEAEIKRVNLTSKDFVNVSTQLYHANNRAAVGFKSMATEIRSLETNVRSGRQALRDMFQEQRVGDRTMREGAATLNIFGSMFGPDFSSAVNTTTNALQQTEFTINATAIAAERGSPAVAAFGASLAALATPIMVLGATFVGELMLFNKFIDEIESAQKRIRAAQGLTEKGPTTSWWRTFLEDAVGGGNPVMEFFGMMSKTATMLNKAAFAAEHQIVFDEMTITGVRGGTHEDPSGERGDFSPIEFTYGPFGGAHPLGTGAENRARLSKSRKKNPLLVAGTTVAVPSFTPSYGSEGDIFGDMDVKSKALFEGMTAGVQTVADGIQTFIGGALNKVFGGEANSLIEKMVANIMSSFAKVGTEAVSKSLLKGLFGMIPGMGFLSEFIPHANGGVLMNPTIGFDLRTGQGHLFAENGPEAIQPLGRGGMDFTPIVRAVNALRSDFASSHPVSLVKAVAYSGRQQRSSIF